MEQQANYIRRIEIHGLWERFNIGWDLKNYHLEPFGRIS